MRNRLLALALTMAVIPVTESSWVSAATMNYVGAWSASTNYAIGAVVIYGNQAYYATAANKNVIPSPTSTAWKLIATNGMDYKGAWNTTTTYQVGSVVNYKGQNFYSLQATNLNKNPETQTAWWVLVGTNGNTVKSGAGAPLATQGVIGDFWIDTTNKILFGPKTVSGWPLQGTSMIGPAGATGAKGATGATGAQGPAGATGATGPQGAVGPKGATGAVGPQGVPGVGYGATTSTTSITIANNVVHVFAVNAVGAYSVGSRVRIISTAAPSKYIEGVISYVSGTSISVLADAFSGSGTYSSWAFSLAGNVGTQGQKGDTGAVGATGATGPQGPQGVAGATGPMGVSGPQGAKGNTGATGLQGPPGPKGDTGPAGPTPPPSVTVNVNCGTGGSIQTAIDGIVAGSVGNINVTGDCSENLIVARGKTINIIGATSSSRLAAANAGLPALVSYGETTVQKLNVVNATGTAETLLTADRGGYLHIIGSELSAPNVGTVVALWQHSGGRVVNTKISGGTDSALEVWGGSDVTLVGNPNEISGPDGFRSSISSPNGWAAIGCAIGSSIAIRANTGNSSDGSVIISNSRSGIGGNQCSANIANKTSNLDNLSFTGMANDGTAFSLQGSELTISKVKIANNGGFGINVNMSNVSIDGSLFDNNQAGDIASGLNSTIHISDWGGQPTSFPDIGSGGGLNCWTGSEIYTTQAAIVQDVSDLPDLASCVFIE